jgi:hypothetical protein
VRRISVERLLFPVTADINLLVVDVTNREDQVVLGKITLSVAQMMERQLSGNAELEMKNKIHDIVVTKLGEDIEYRVENG